jgi:peptide/nickel transport system permease protein
MNRLGYIGIAVAALFILAAIFAPLIATHDVSAQNLALRYMSPSAEHWFGTDGLGRDVFSRVVFGARISLEVGITVVVVCSIIGVIIALVAFLGAGQGKLILALCVIGWVGYARVMRGQVLKVREYDYVMAARALGAGNMRILFTHILPNAIQPLIVQASLGMAGAVLSEASLSFLGLGIPPPAPSWGTMIEEARQFFSSTPHVLFFPGVAIALTVLAFNFIGDGLREYLDPKQRSR